MEWKFETRMANGKPYDRYEYDSAIRMKYSTSKPEDFDLETRAWRAYQVEEVKKVLSKRSYLEHANRRAEALDTLWTKERADSATYGRNWGYYVGLENIRKYYVDGNPFGGAGTDVCHPFTTYKIIIADDNKTAQATWYSIGYEINPALSKDVDCYWDDQRCGADLVYEDGQWKIWHSRIFPVFRNDYFKDFAKAPEADLTATKFRDGLEDFHAFFRYTPDCVMPRSEPEIPLPYDTWEPGWNFGVD